MDTDLNEETYKDQEALRQAGLLEGARLDPSLKRSPRCPRCFELVCEHDPKDPFRGQAEDLAKKTGGGGIYVGSLPSVEAVSLEARIDFILAQIKREVMRASRKHRAMAGAHEGWAVIWEELDELWDHVKADTGKTPAAAVEAMQIAAMGVRYLLDVTPRDTLPYLEKQ